MMDKIRKTVSILGICCVLLSLEGCGSVGKAVVKSLLAKVTEDEAVDVTETSETENSETGSSETGSPETGSSEIESSEIESSGTVERGKPALLGIAPLEFSFSSGAGAWGTSLTLEEDGSFYGSYHDSDMGDSGQGYPNGTVYDCVFAGSFGNIRQVNGYTYSLDLEDLHCEKEDGTVWIENGIRYIASSPLGLEDGTQFYLYTPQTPVAGLPENFLSWWPARFSLGVVPKTLSCYGLHNLKMDYGFFTYEDPPQTAPPETQGRVIVNSQDYILPESNSRYLTEADVRNLNKSQLRLARNEIYARRGRMFDSADLQEYFNSKSWYHGFIKPSDFSDNMLNAYEKKNIMFLKKHEDNFP